MRKRTPTSSARRIASRLERKLDKLGAAMEESVEEASRALPTLHPTGFGFALLLISFLAGQFSAPFVFLAAFGVWVFAEHRRYRRQQRRDNLTVVREALNHPQAVQRLLPDLPAWIQFPDMERATWLERLISRLWSRINKATEASVLASVNPLLTHYKPGFLSHLKLTRVDLGHDSLQVAGVKCLDSIEDNVQLDLSLVLNTPANIILSLGYKHAEAKVRVTDIDFSGVLRVTLAPLCDGWPCFGAVSVAFVKPPHLDFELQGMGINVMSIPGFDTWLRKFIVDMLAYYIVWPQNLVVPILADVSVDKVRELGTRAPVGMLHVVLESADDLEETGVINVFSKSSTDPYVILKLDAKQQFKSTIKDNTTTPVWGEDFEFLVYDRESAVLKLKVFDDGVVGKDERLGYATVPIASLEDNEPTPLNLPLVNVKSGRLRLVASYSPLLSHSRDNSKAPEVIEETREAVASNVHVEVEASPGLGLRQRKGAKSGAKWTAAAEVAEKDYHSDSEEDQEQVRQRELRAKVEAAAGVMPARTVPPPAPLEPALTRSNCIASDNEGAEEDDDDDMDGDDVEYNLSAGVLRVFLERCSNLIAADSNGLSDPFVEFHVGNQKKKSAIKKKTLDPTYGENFEFRVADPGREVLVVKVMDWNRVFENEEVGELRVPIIEVLKVGRVENEWKLHGVKHGKVHMALEFLSTG